MIVALLLSALAAPAVAADVPPPSMTPEQEAIRRANMEMMARYYPKGALKRGEEGNVGVSVTIDTKGYPTGCEVTKSSGYRDLDSATCEVMLMYGKTNPFLDGKRKVQRTVDGEFAWTLPPGVARAKVAAANLKSEKASQKLASNDPNKLICRTQTRTGSLAERTRICMTAGEWMNQRNASQGDVQEMQRRQAMNNN